MTISNRVWRVQHPNSGRNIQHVGYGFLSELLSSLIPNLDFYFAHSITSAKYILLLFQINQS